MSALINLASPLIYLDGVHKKCTRAFIRTARALGSKATRWPRLRENAPQPTIGKLVGDAMAAIEKENPSLKGVLPKDYARPSLDKQRLGELIDEANLGPHHADTFHDDKFPDLKADFILANPPFNISDWGGESLSPPLPQGEGGGEGGGYADVPGFCKSATLEEVRKHGHVLTPGRYVGAEAQADDGEPFEEKMKRLVAQLREQQAEAFEARRCDRRQPEGAGALSIGGTIFNLRRM